MDSFLRILKSVTLGAVVFFSLRYLGFPVEGCFVVALVPLVLGTLNVLISVAYGLSGIIFLLACLSALFPRWPEYMRPMADFIERSVSNKNPSSLPREKPKAE